MSKNSKKDINEAFRLAMRRFASTISIITTTQEDNFYGMAATAVTSLSFEPLSILAAVNSSASLHKPLLESKAFCVNILKTDQTHQCEIFSSQDLRSKRFKEGAWKSGHLGLPFLEGAQANIFCSMSDSINSGSHTAFIGLVKEVHIDELVDPLVYLDGKFVKQLDSLKSSSEAPVSLEGIDWLW